MVTIHPGVRFGMLDNAEHSLVRAYESLLEALREDDPYLVKEAVVWLYHGVELCLKQLLVERSEYLVLQNVNSGIKKLAKLRDEAVCQMRRSWICWKMITVSIRSATMNW